MADDEIAAFMASYHGAVFNRLVQIDSRPTEDEDRFLILEGDPPQDYTQVWLDGDHHKAHVEASSYFWEFEDPAKRRYISAKGHNALAQLGFDLTSEDCDNYLRTLQIDAPADLWGVAGLLLEALYRGYGVGIGQVRFTSPYGGAPQRQLLPMNEPCRAPLDASSPDSAH